MLKYYDTAVTMSEFPDEISLCVNITNCPGTCEECSEPWLRKDIGTVLTNEEIDKLVALHPGCSVFGLMGGDADHADVRRIAEYVHRTYSHLKVGFYSGCDYIDLSLVSVVDFYKIGRWVRPLGSPTEWWKHRCGPLNFAFSNQKYFEIRDNKIIDATEKFGNTPIGDLRRYIV